MRQIRRTAGALTLALLVGSSSLAQHIGSEVVTELRVHGNFATPDAEVVRLAGIEVGDEFGPGVLDCIAARLRATDRFDDVEVRKRYRSLTQGDEVTLILVVRERPSVARGGPIVRALKAASQRTLLVPMLDHSEGHGFTYGARLTLVDGLGRGGRLSVPLTLGGTRQAALEIEKPFDAVRFTRFVAASRRSASRTSTTSSATGASPPGSGPTVGLRTLCGCRPS